MKKLLGCGLEMLHCNDFFHHLTSNWSLCAQRKQEKKGKGGWGGKKSFVAINEHYYTLPSFQRKCTLYLPNEQHVNFN